MTSHLSHPCPQPGELRYTFTDTPTRVPCSRFVLYQELGWRRVWCRALVLCALHCLSACTSAVEEAQQRVDFAKSNGASNAEICRLGRELARAMLDAKDPRYREQAAIADVDCLTAEVGRR